MKCQYESILVLPNAYFLLDKTTVLYFYTVLYISLLLATSFLKYEISFYLFMHMNKTKPNTFLSFVLSGIHIHLYCWIRWIATMSNESFVMVWINLTSNLMETYV